MSGWMWFLLWAVLVVGSLVVFALVGRSLWHKAAALGEELAVASDRFAAIQEQLDKLDSDDLEELAVFAVPLSLRQDREIQRMRRERARRRAYRRMILGLDRQTL